MIFTVRNCVFKKTKVSLRKLPQRTNNYSKGLDSFFDSLSNKLLEVNIIRTEILDNAQKAKDTMVENANSSL